MDNNYLKSKKGYMELKMYDYKLEILDEQKSENNVLRLFYIEADRTEKRRVFLNLMQKEECIGLIEFLTKGSVIENKGKKSYGIIIYERVS